MAPQKTVFWEVDAQADFMLPGGKLYVPGAEKIIPNIERLVAGAIEAGALLISSGDSHPEGDVGIRALPAALPSRNVRRANRSRGIGRKLLHHSKRRLPRHAESRSEFSAGNF